MYFKCGNCIYMYPAGINLSDSPDLKLSHHNIHTYNISMKAKPKGHMAVKLYKLEEAHPTTAAAALSNNYFDNRKELIFHVFPKDPYLSTFQHTII